MIANVNSSQLNILRLGTLIVTARQEGDANYNSADVVVRIIQVVDNSNPSQEANAEWKS